MSDDIEMIDADEAPAIPSPSPDGALQTKRSATLHLMKNGHDPSLMRLLNTKKYDQAVEILKKAGLETSIDIPGATQALIDNKIAYHLSKCGPIFKNLEVTTDQEAIDCFNKAVKKTQQELEDEEQEYTPDKYECIKEMLPVYEAWKSIAVIYEVINGKSLVIITTQEV